MQKQHMDAHVRGRFQEINFDDGKVMFRILQVHHKHAGRQKAHKTPRPNKNAVNDENPTAKQNENAVSNHTLRLRSERTTGRFRTISTT